MSNNNNKSSSFDAFSKVDELVSKPVLGSDGAASWQSFRKDHKPKFESTAPKAPLKRADKLGTGFKSWEEERAHEAKIRQQAGHAATNAGYSKFRIKHNDEAASRKRKQQVQNRIRPDDKEYYIKATTFEGWKFDYVFTTKNGNTGYYWDGMDSIKQENGELKTRPVEASKESNADTTTTKKPKKKRKKDKEKSRGPTFVHDPNNPMEQMQAILQQRNQKLTADNSLPSGWEAAKDPSTGKTYYFHRASGQRSWEKPKNPEELPEGWKSTVDPASGKTYYHHTSGKTSWTKPE